jgi:plastocyanin
MDQEAPSSGRVRAPSARTQESPYAPSNTAQAAQTSAAANTFAEAATRSEIEPGNTLGGESYAASSGTQNAAAARSVVVQLRGDGSQQFSPATVTVKVGTTVKWTNASTRTHDISANPGKQLSTTTLPAGAKPFDSGFLRPGASFTYSFKVPGVYRYVCSVGCVGNASGEVVVQR